MAWRSGAVGYGAWLDGLAVPGRFRPDVTIERDRTFGWVGQRATIEPAGAERDGPWHEMRTSGRE